MNLALVAQTESLDASSKEVSTGEFRVFLTDAKRFGISLLLATGSKQHLRELEEITNEKGCRLTKKSLFKGSKVITSKSEEEIIRRSVFKLVDRLWPRGLRMEDAAVDHWCKELAPSTALRQWFGHTLERWEEFGKRYKAELAAALAELRAFARKGPITLRFAAHDELHNNAGVVHEFLCAKPRSVSVPVKTTGKTRRKT